MASEGGGVVVRGPPAGGGGGGGGGGGSGETDSPLRGDRAGEAGAGRLEARGGGGAEREEQQHQAGQGEAEPGLEPQEDPLLLSPLPGLEELRLELQGWLRPYGGLLMALQRLLVWERPLYSLTVALSLNTLFWLVSSMSLRPLFLISVSLLGLMLLERWKHKLAIISVQHVEPEPSQVQRDSVHHPGLLSVQDLSLHLADSYLTCCLYLKEALQYKKHQPGKFCIMVCSGCAVLAVVGHYVPGIMISYIMALSVLLWPLVVYHELIQRMYTGLEPILMKLDYSMKGGAAGRRHDKRIIALLREVKKELESSGGDEPRAETESDSEEEEEEEELSCFAPTVDAKLTALAMAITDSELSDEEASILESGGFSVSRATTPNLSEDLDVQSVHSEPDESCLTSDLLTSAADLPEFLPTPALAQEGGGLFHVAPPRGQSPASPQGQGEGPSPSPSPSRGREESSDDGGRGDAECPSLSLLQQLASPLHFVNTHFNGHTAAGVEAGSHADDGAAGVAGAGARLLLGAAGGPEDDEEEEDEEERLGASPPPPAPPPSSARHRSLEALSEEIVSTAISAVVQNTRLSSSSSANLATPPSGSKDQQQQQQQPLSALLPPSGSKEQQQQPLSALLPPSGSEDQTTTTTTTVANTLSISAPASALERLLAAAEESDDAGARDASSMSVSELKPAAVSSSSSSCLDPFFSLRGETTTETAVHAAGTTEPEHVAALATEEEDFELLDQSELDEELLAGGGGEGGGRGLAGVVGGTSGGATTDTPLLSTTPPPPPPLHQSEESSS